MLLFDEAPWIAETSLPDAFHDDFPNRILLQHGSALKESDWQQSWSSYKRMFYTGNNRNEFLNDCRYLAGSFEVDFTCNMDFSLKRALGRIRNTRFALPAIIVLSCGSWAGPVFSSFWNQAWRNNFDFFPLTFLTLFWLLRKTWKLIEVKLQTAKAFENE